MKKTFMMLTVLGSIAAYAVETQDAAVNIMQTSQYEDSAWNYTSTVWGSQAFTLTDVTVSPTITGDNSAYCTTNKAYTKSFAVVNTNIGNGGVFNYAINFTVKYNEGITSVTLSKIAVDLFSITSGGDPQGSNKNVKCSYTLSCGEAQIATGNLTATIPGGNANKAVYTGDATDGYALASGETPGVFTISLGDVALTDGATYTLKLNDVMKADGAGTLIGLGNVAFSGLATPEPATATLSLLALAGLASRRRRK